MRNSNPRSEEVEKSAQDPATESESNLITTIPEYQSVLYEMHLQMGSLVLNLNKNYQTFICTNLEKSTLEFYLNNNNTMSVSV